jgi:hypothetical protein
MSERFSRLQSQIQGNTWLGNPVFQLNSHFRELMSIDADWLLALPAFQAVENIPGFRPLFDSIRSVENFTDLARRTTLLFAETAHCINQRYNAMDESVTFLELSSFPPADRSESFYQAVAIAHNEVLRVPDLLEVWRSSPLPQMGDVYEILLGAETETIQELEQRIQALREPAREIENVRERWQLWELQQILQEAYENAGISGGPGGISLNFTGNLPVATPGNMGIIVDGLSRITQLFLSFFSATIVPGDAIAAIVQATNTIVLKFFDVGAGSLLGDMAAAVLRAVDLPAIYSLTTTFAGVWAFLMAYAPLIILAAICAIAVIRNSRRLRIGEHLNVFAGLPGSPSAMAFGGLANPSRATMKAALIELAQDLRNDGANFEPVLGFVLDSRDRVAMALELTSLDDPVELFGEAMDAAAAPYQNQLGRSFDDWWNA